MRAELPAGEIVPGPGCDVEELKTKLVASEEGWGIEEMSDLGRSWKFFLRAAAGGDAAVSGREADAGDGRAVVGDLVE